jgi:hypothetical protein
MGNLNASSVNSGDPRPFQNGEVTGTKHGAVLQAAKEWLVDTGASISAITKSNADQFDLTITGASASATTGGGGIIMKSGLSMVFKVLDEATGTDNKVHCSLDVGVKDPTVQDGDLYQ